MNIIEPIWDALKRAIQKRSPPPLTPMDLWTVLQDSWCELPPGYLQTLVRDHATSYCSTSASSWGPYTILGRCTSFSGSSEYKFGRAEKVKVS
ncbi:hypothetical protein AVEN_717-1 [Araneus ventricosus]|uniref:Tc1-like transposase DDE domain-containing protein n=1 Tax=Araneus ventricosus TaxID=182803 RepID=A0A4Y2BV28_ARAVE|nr:hypothetical protein AVEN_717-1 [Araneus ventricosus]